MAEGQAIIIQPSTAVITITEDGGVREVAGSSATIEVLGSGLVNTSGGGASFYLHTQGSALTIWTIAHNLGRKPSVAVRSVGGLEVMGGEVLHLSSNTLQITFDTAFAGEAYLT